MQHERALAGEFERGVDSREEALAAGLFVTGRAVDLAGEVQALNAFCFKRRAKLSRRREVVFDGVSVAHDFRVFKTLDRADHFVLNVSGQAGRNAVAVNLKRVPAFGLKENLVRVLFRKPNDFVFDRRTVAWAG